VSVPANRLLRYILQQVAQPRGPLKWRAQQNALDELPPFVGDQVVSILEW
jgi:hypothetical protein